MARRGRLDKFRAPEPEPSPAPATEGQPPQAEQAPATAAEPKEKAFESERLMLFGPPATQKNIAVFAIVGFVFMGLFYFLLSREVKPFPVAGLVFTAVHGALLGMLVGQLFLVYPDRLIILFTLMAMVVAETIYGAARWSGLQKFEFNRERFQEIVAILFWAGFVGFWIGFIFFVNRLRARERFKKRYSA